MYKIVYILDGWVNDDIICGFTIINFMLLYLHAKSKAF